MPVLKHITELLVVALLILCRALSQQFVFDIIICSTLFKQHSFSRQGECDSVGYEGMQHNRGLIGVEDKFID